MFRLLVFLIVSSMYLNAQQTIGHACAKAGLRAVKQIDKNPASAKALAALIEQTRKCDSGGESELAADLLVRMFSSGRREAGHSLPCAAGMKQALRRDRVPPLCFNSQIDPPNWDDFRLAWQLDHPAEF